ncbi:MAG: response regulator [Planctomycetota bacterium]|nr:response regulator [Planctomycetota bacterium]
MSGDSDGSGHALQEINPRVLVADDRADHLALARTLLQSMGCSVDTVNDGTAAVDAVWRAASRGTAYDLILMDVQLPSLDAWAATRALRTAGHSGPIFAVSAVADRVRPARDGRSVFDATIPKPLTREGLAEASRATLASRG